QFAQADALCPPWELRRGPRRGVRTIAPRDHPVQRPLDLLWSATHWLELLRDRFGPLGGSLPERGGVAGRLDGLQPDEAVLERARPHARCGRGGHLRRARRWERAPSARTAQPRTAAFFLPVVRQPRRQDDRVHRPRRPQGAPYYEAPQVFLLDT